ncbi:MAG: hypothetical protein ABL955_03215 [Elusimicrobiota bacterium]
MITLLLWIALVAPARVQAAQTNAALEYRTLDGLNLDLWMDGFWKDPAELGATPAKYKDAISAAYSPSDSVSDFYQKLLGLELNRRYTKPEGYRRLVGALMAVRRDLRPPKRRDFSIVEPSEELKQALLLLEVLTEETIYAASIRFPETAEKDWTAQYEKISDELCSYDGKRGRTATYRGIKFCQGDVIISKEDSLFSSFAARMITLPQLFSHASVAYVRYSDAGRRLQLLETNGQDHGVKLRDPADTYKDVARFFVYRARASDPGQRREYLRSAITGADRYMTVITQMSGGDPVNKVSFLFDFYYRPADPKEQYCSEVAYDVYNRGGLTGAKNPYPAELWNTFDNPPDSPDFWKKASGVEAGTFHDASDVDLNPNFDLISYTIDPKRVSRERIDTAISDVAFAFIKDDTSGVRARYLESLSGIGDRGITPGDIAALRATRLFPDLMVDNIAKRVRPGPNLKMALFYIVIDQMLGSAREGSLRSRMIAADAKAVAVTGRPLGLIALRREAAAVMRKDLESFLKNWEKRRKG